MHNAGNPWDNIRGLAGKNKDDFGHGAAQYVTFLNVIENVTVCPEGVELVDVRSGESQHLVRNGDILFNGTSETPDELAMGSAVVDDTTDVYLNSFCFGFRPFDSASLDPKFLAYFFRGPTGRDHLARLAQGATRYNLSKRQFLTLEIALPHLDEQHKISEVLSDVDGLIAVLDQLIAKKRAIKLATMQQLLTARTRLPGFTKPWQNTTLGRIGSTYGGLSAKSKEDFGVGSARYVTFLNVLENVVLDPAQFAHVRVSRGESQNRVLEGDLLFNGTSETPGDLAMGSVLQESQDDLYLNSFCFGFRVHDQAQCDPLFLAYYFRGSPGRDVMYALAQGATRYNMSKRQFLALDLPLPASVEQVAIASVLSDMDAEIAALARRWKKTRAVKQGMMQQLLTGRIRLVKPRAEGESPA